MAEWIGKEEAKQRLKEAGIESLSFPDSDDSFPFLITRHFFETALNAKNPKALLSQILPSVKEEKSPPHYRLDPLRESAAIQSKALLQKYRNRVLLVTTGACAAHCRYCFRRHFPYQEHGMPLSEMRTLFSKLRALRGISELILSGGDPLMLSEKKWRALIDSTETLPWIKRLRIHTRVPIFSPQRITESLLIPLKRLKGKKIGIVVVVHVNCADELTQAVQNALAKIKESADLLNQSVLLRGINDSLGALKALSEKLFECGVLPYYIHQLDRVRGAAHFEVPLEEGRALMQKLRDEIPGYLVPRFVTEIPGQQSKTILS